MEISIITVTKNRKNILLDKLESIRNQSLDQSTFELILLNNASTDGTKEALAEKDIDINIKIINLKQELSISKARNKCVEQAKGKYLYFSDDDCILSENTLELHLKIQKTKPIISLGAIIFKTKSYEYWLPKNKYWFTNGANTALPKEAFDAIGGFDEDLENYGGEDLLLGYKLALFGLGIMVLPDAKVRHIGPNPVTGNNLLKAFSAGKNAAIITNKYPLLAFRFGVSPWLLGLKKAIYLSALQIITKKLIKRFDYERLYLLGVLEQKQMMKGKDV